MGRKLPWGSSNGTISTAARPVKRQKVKVEPVIKPEADESDRFLNTPQKPKRRNGRTPSTSPPPVPPDIVFMREGVDGDDVYMMVEDEFQTVAQSFTAHLHMAEYRRLKQEARERQRDRPVVPAKASFEVKYKHAQKELEERQKTTLKAMTGGEDEEQVEEEIVEPWAGTSLAGLMRWDGSQRTSLKGLDKLNSGSRASQGLGPNSEKGTQSQGTQRVIEQDVGVSKQTERAGSSLQVEDTRVRVKKERNNTTASRDSQHKNMPKQEHRLPRLATATESRESTNGQDARKQSKQLEEVTRKTNTDSSRSSLSTQKTSRARFRTETTPRSFLDDLNDFDDAKFTRSQYDKPEDYDIPEPKPQARSPVKPRVKSEITMTTTEARSTKLRVKTEINKTETKAKKKDRKSRYDEIPVFLY